MAAVAVLVGCSSAPPAGRDTEPATTRRMLDYLSDALDREQFRGTVEVRLGDQVLLDHGFGDAAHGVPNRPGTRFRIASVTKQFTALAVLMLHEQGRLAVTDPVCRHLPDCPPAWRPITIDQLLTHTSGLADYADTDPVAAERFFTKIGTRQPSPEQLTTAFAGRPLEFAPGTRWDYSNSGYVLLGRVVEARSGQDYGRFLRNAILEPLGMNDTGYQSGLDTPEGFATGYHGWAATADTYDSSVYYAAGGMYSTVRDMARWNDFLMTGRPAVVDRDTLGELLRARVEVNATEQYGYGIQTRGTAGDIVYFHSGLVAGFASYNEVQPARRVSITVMSNVDTVDASGIGRTLAMMART